MAVGIMASASAFQRKTQWAIGSVTVPFVSRGKAKSPKRQSANDCEAICWAGAFCFCVSYQFFVHYQSKHGHHDKKTTDMLFTRQCSNAQTSTMETRDGRGGVNEQGKKQKIPPPPAKDRERNIGLSHSDTYTFGHHRTTNTLVTLIQSHCRQHGMAGRRSS